MGFKLGKERGNYAVNGEIRTKMRFGKNSGGDNSVPGTPVIRKPLEEGVRGEANMDGSIYINEDVIPGSFEERDTINHEMRHATEIRIGKLSYADDHVMYNGDRYERQDRLDKNGKIVDCILIDGYWYPAGSNNFPWEINANNGS